MTPIDIVYSIFKNYFGEEYTDLQETTILVHFPEIIITNEFNVTHLIKDLYVKVVLEERGELCGTFTMSRATLTADEVSHGYSHSHLPVHSYGEFLNPCLGMGPIRNTCASLNSEFNEDLWELFCIELDKYVRVESTAGGPYIRITSLGGNSLYKVMDYDLTSIETVEVEDNIMPILDKFLNESLKFHKFKYNFHGYYDIAMSMYQFMLMVGDKFTKWYKDEDNLTGALLEKYHIENNKIYLWSLYTNSARINSKLCIFKGKDIYVTTIEDTEQSYVILLKSRYVFYLYYQLVRTINLIYGIDYKTANNSPATIEGSFMFI